MNDNIQPQIDNILLSKNTSEQKIRKLRELFRQAKIEVFSDFDDTITDPKSILTIRYYILTRILKRSDANNELVKYIFFNKNYFELLNTINKDTSKIIILTGNSHTFVSSLIPMLRSSGYPIVGVVGQWDNIHFKKSQKPDFIPEWWVLLWDEFENSMVKELTNFYKIKSLNKYQVILHKIGYLFLFTIKIIFKRRIQ